MASCGPEADGRIGGEGQHHEREAAAIAVITGGAVVVRQETAITVVCGAAEAGSGHPQLLQG